MLEEAEDHVADDRVEEKGNVAARIQLRRSARSNRTPYTGLIALKKIFNLPCIRIQNRPQPIATAYFHQAKPPSHTEYFHRQKSLEHPNVTLSSHVRFRQQRRALNQIKLQATQLTLTPRLTNQ